MIYNNNVYEVQHYLYNTEACVCNNGYDDFSFYLEQIKR